ncbi:MAG: SCP-like extracellular [Solirubrobacterales bacterium]|jgi:uncharacterized protein YkwD|nr:SCP-like extracellular [Solirubrobacterales bacterium]
MSQRALILLVAAATLVPASASAAPSLPAAALLAPASACSGQSSASAPAAAQEAAMACLVDYARRRAGVPGLRRSRLLTRAAAGKAHDLLSCQQFSHTACGRAFTTRIDAAGYRYRLVGENLALGDAASGTPSVIMRAWLGSAEHRANLLRPSYRDQGIAMRPGGMPGYPHAHVWVDEFGAPAAP